MKLTEVHQHSLPSDALEVFKHLKKEFRLERLFHLTTDEDILYAMNFVSFFLNNRPKEDMHVWLNNLVVLKEQANRIESASSAASSCLTEMTDYEPQHIKDVGAFMLEAENMSEVIQRKAKACSDLVSAIDYMTENSAEEDNDYRNAIWTAAHEHLFGVKPSYRS